MQKCCKRHIIRSNVKQAKHAKFKLAILPKQMSENESKEAKKLSCLRQNVWRKYFIFFVKDACKDQPRGFPTSLGASSAVFANT